MNFINPFYLFALSAASIPIIIHLLNLRKQQKIEFSTLFFLREMQKTKIRNIKIKKWLLLLIRTLIIISLVLAFSRPTIKSTIPGFSIEARKSHIIVVDNSYSMEYKDENGIRIEQAKNIALELLKSVKNEEEVCIIPMSADLSNLYFSRDKDKIEDIIKQIKLENFNENFNSIMNFALKMTQAATNQNKVIYFISDMPQSYFRTSQQIYTDYVPVKEKIDENTGFIFIPIKSASDNIKNLSLTNLKLNNSILQVGGSFTVDINVKNHSKQDFYGVVMNMYLNEERVAQRKFDIGSEVDEIITIGANIKKSGVQNVKLEIENDALDFDNYKYFNINIPKIPKVLLIGDADKQKFLILALGENPNDYKKSIVQNKSNVDEQNKLVNLTVVSSDQIGSQNLDEFDLIIVGNGVINNNDSETIRKAISNGKNAIIFTDIIEPDDFLVNRNYGDDYVPNQFLNFLNILQISLDSDKDFRADIKITDFDREHPIFDGLFSENTKQKLELESPIFTDYNPIMGGKNLISIGGATGFLTEIDLEKGNILYFAVNNQADWSNFPFISLYPALIYRSVVYLNSTKSTLRDYDKYSRYFNINTQDINLTKLKVVAPDNTESFPEFNTSGNSVFINLKDYKQLGNYNVYNENELIDAFEINTPPTESFFYDKLDLQTFNTYFDVEFGARPPFEIIDNIDNLSNKINLANMGSELWKFFAILTLLLVIIEMIVQKYYAKTESN